MSMQDKEMLTDLVVESREHLSEIEPDLLELEQKGAGISAELVNRIFRAVHSIKGGFGFFGIEHITRLSHAMENVMVRVRDKQLAIIPEVTDALLRGVDKLRVLLDDAGHADSVPIEAELGGLSPFMDTAVASAPKSVPAPGGNEASDGETAVRIGHPGLTEEQVKEAARNGQFVYQITVNFRADLADKNIVPKTFFETWEKLGEILDVSFDAGAITGLRGSSNMELPFSIIFATVLEPDLVGVGTGIANEQIYAMDTTSIRNALLQAPAASQEQAAASVQRAAAVGPGMESGGAALPEKRATVETRIEDALRVKVSLLNNLMNLAGELVLSRNQLMQNVDRKLSEAVDVEALFRNVEQQIEHSRGFAPDATVKPGGDGTPAAATAAGTRIRDLLAESLSMRLVDVPGLTGILQNLDMVTSMLQESIMQTRLQPISVVFAKFPRLVRDLAKKLDKEVNLTLVGQDVELDKSMVEQLSDPLTHLVRNAIDHGVEAPGDRARAGKPPQGEVVLRAFHESGKVHIQVQDNGAGIDRLRVKEKALAMGLLTADDLDKMTDREIDGIIMLPGFSTAAAVSDVSGRGVGMDVVKTNIERLGGVVEIESTQGTGTTITMKLPLTLAIISSLVVSAGGRRFAIPQVGISELVRVRARDVTTKIERIHNSEVMRLRGRLLPLVRLTGALGMKPSFARRDGTTRMDDNRQRWSDRRSESPANVAEAVGEADARGGAERRQGADRRTNLANAVTIVVLKYGVQHFGLVVEDVYDSEEIVVKPLSGYLKSCQCYAGATIMGDGSVAMILDTNGIAALSGLKFADLEKNIEAEEERRAKESSKALRELLLFSAGGDGAFALDLARVARVEKVETSRIVRVGNREILKYDDKSLRLIRLSDYLPVSASSVTNGRVFVIVPKGFAHQMGIVADQVRDVVRTGVALDTGNIRGPGIQGCAMINSTLTIVIDIDAVFRAAEPDLCAQGAANAV